MFEEEREEFSTEVRGTTSGDIPATMASVNTALDPHQDSAPKHLARAAPLIPGPLLRMGLSELFGCCCTSEAFLPW